MVRYAAAKLFSTPDKTAIARGSNVRTSFKNMREVGAAIQGLNLKQAYKYLNNVLEHKDVIPFRRYSGGVGRTAQAAKHGTSQGRWPEKSVKHILRILKNAEANAEQKTIDGESLKIRSVVVQQAQKNHRRTYRAHGRINRYDGHPCHVEVVLTSPTERVPRNKDKDELKGLSRQQLARKRLLAIRAPPAAAEAQAKGLYRWQSKATFRNVSTQASSIVVEGKTFPTDSHTNVTQTIIDKIPRRLHLTPSHPLNTLRTRIESSFPSFTAINSLSPLVTPKQNFDDLGFPPDHPGRSLTDSYYINKDMMLRTHTSAHEVQVFRDQVERWLLIADVYRRDEIDSSHYPVFHQVEGARTFDLTTSEKIKELEAENGAMEAKLTSSNIIIEDETVVGVDNPYQIEHDPYQASLVLANLKHHLNSLILNLFSTPAGGDKSEPLRVRWIPAYFPWTGPSYEVEVLFQGKWLEILGCGVVQNHTLVRSDVNDRLAWAFGLGLERIAMVLYNIPDIRLFWSTDPRFLSQFTDGKVTTFKPYSKYPPCYKDISLWVDVPSSDEASKPAQSFHENDFCDIVRDTAGDLVEDVKKIDEFVHPKTGRRSVCYRINYRSMDRSLSNDEVNVIHGKVEKSLLDRLSVEIR